MAYDYSNDHPNRDYAIQRFYREVLDLTYFDMQHARASMKHLRYRELIRALVIKDRENGVEFGMICIRFKERKHKIRRLILNYSKNDTST